MTSGTARVGRKTRAVILNRARRRDEPSHQEERRHWLAEYRQTLAQVDSELEAHEIASRALSQERGILLCAMSALENGGQQ